MTKTAEIRRQNLAYIFDWLRKNSDLKPHVKIQSNNVLFAIPGEPKAVLYPDKNEVVIGGKTFNQSAYMFLTRLGRQ